MMMIQSRRARSGVDDLRQTEVHDLDGCGGAGRVDNHNVLRLQVAVDDAHSLERRFARR